MDMKAFLECQAAIEDTEETLESLKDEMKDLWVAHRAHLKDQLTNHMPFQFRYWDGHEQSVVVTRHGSSAGFYTRGGREMRFTYDELESVCPA